MDVSIEELPFSPDVPLVLVEDAAAGFGHASIEELPLGPDFSVVPVEDAAAGVWDVSIEELPVRPYLPSNLVDDAAAGLWWDIDMFGRTTSERSPPGQLSSKT